MAGRISYLGGIVTQGLVLDLDAAKRDSYAGVGTAWNDISGNQNNGTLVNGPTFNSGNGGSIVFDGVNDYVDCGNILSNPSSFTLCTWFKSSNTSQTNKGILGRWGGSSTPNTGYMLWIDVLTNPGRLALPINAAPHLTGTTDIRTGAWFYLSGTFNGTTATIYVNGISEGSQSESAISISNNTFDLGRYVDNGGNGQYVQGNISQTQVYNRALSATEILQNYNATKGRYL